MANDNFDYRTPVVPVRTTDVHDRATAISFALDLRFLSIKRMPRINHLAYIGFMGLKCLGCTILAAALVQIAICSCFCSGFST